MPSFRCRVRKLKSKTMGDAAKPYFVKRTKDRGSIDDEDFRRGHPQQDYLIMDDYAKGHSSKMEKGLPKKKITPGNYGNTPRKGPYAVSSNPYAFKNPIYSQPAWMNENHKDQSKRWLSDELAGNSDTWREFKPGPRIPVINRPRKDSFQESEDGYRWQDGRGCRTVRRLFHKDLTSLETMSEMEAGSPGNVFQLVKLQPQSRNVFFIQMRFIIFSIPVLIFHSSCLLFNVNTLKIVIMVFGQLQHIVCIGPFKKLL